MLVLSSLNPASAGIVSANSVAFKDVEAAIRSAREGDTVVVPAGTINWSSNLVIKRGITLEGATAISGPSNNPKVTDATIILDDLPRVRPPQPIIRVEVRSTESFRLTGFTFRNGSLTKISEAGGVRLEGTCPSVRIDHCHFDSLYENPYIEIRGQLYGVVDHCVLDFAQRGTESFQVFHDKWGGYTNGDGSWIDDPYFGSEKFLFIEDNAFNKTTPVAGGGLDCYGGGRYVARYNTFNNTGPNSHGTESTGRFRGARAIEIYNNRFNWTTLTPRPGQLRSGCMVIHDNVWAGIRAEHGPALTCFREFYPFKFWGAANGTNRLDSNDPHGLYFSGKHTGPNNSETLIVANAGWKTNQWVGYSVTNTTRVYNTGTEAGFHPCSYITANTSDTITFRVDKSIGPNSHGEFLYFNTGDGFEIYEVLIALDQPGRGKGDLLTGRFPVNTGSWPHQALEPVYSWNNTRAEDGSPVNLVGVEPTIQENRDFYNNTPKPGYKPYVYPHPLVTGATPPVHTSSEGGAQ